ncbi:voltage-gated chloride channel protein [bacterium]|nr:voltage-gated chloride channel protein [bacterium]
MHSLYARSKELVFDLVLGVVVGVIGGGVAYAFLRTLNWVNTTRNDNENLIYFLPLAGLVIGLMYHHFGERVANGSNLVLEEIHEPGAGVPRRMAPMVFLATAISHLFGASTGREGAGIQITASVADTIAKPFSPSPETRKLLLITAISAAFGGLFGVPIGGMVFALEVQENGRIRYEAMLPALLAGLVGYKIVESLNIKHLVTGTLVPVDLSLGLSWKLIVLSGVSSILALAFIQLTHTVHRAAHSWIKWQPLRPVAGGCIVLILVLISGSRDYLGLSAHLAEGAFAGVVGIAVGAFAWKLVFTSVSLGTGFIGGEMVPLFIIGALAGAQTGRLLNASIPLFAAIGMMATFAAASNTPIACIVIGIELFGAGATLPLALTCVLAYALSGRRGIYHSQKHALLTRSSSVK